MQLAEAATFDRKSGEPRDLQFRGPFVEMFFDRAQRSGEICGFFLGRHTPSLVPWPDALFFNLLLDKLRKGRTSVMQCML
jgi:hypothetical protein